MAYCAQSAIFSISQTKLRKQWCDGITARSGPFLRTDADGSAPRLPGGALRSSCMSDVSKNYSAARSRAAFFGFQDCVHFAHFGSGRAGFPMFPGESSVCGRGNAVRVPPRAQHSPSSEVQLEEFRGLQPPGSAGLGSCLMVCALKHPGDRVADGQAPERRVNVG